MTLDKEKNIYVMKMRSNLLGILKRMAKIQLVLEIKVYTLAAADISWSMYAASYSLSKCNFSSFSFICAYVKRL
jgi:hypothetical protein